MANVQVDAVPSRWEDSTPMAKALTRSAPIAGIAIILLALSANSVLAWGDTAHRIICEIAFKELNSQARAEVKRLIRLDPVFFTFSGSCIWPDHPRKRSREHFVNLPRSATQLENDSCPLVDKCVAYSPFSSATGGEGIAVSWCFMAGGDIGLNSPSIQFEASTQIVSWGVST